MFPVSTTTVHRNAALGLQDILLSVSLSMLESTSGASAAHLQAPLGEFLQVLDVDSCVDMQILVAWILVYDG